MRNILGALLLIGAIYFLLTNIDQADEVVFNEPAIPAEDIVQHDGLVPEVKKKSEQLQKQAEAEGIDVVITDGYRSAEEQNELFAEGRESTDGGIVTYAEGGSSYHNYGLAVDFALRLDDGQIVWDTERDDNDNGEADWMEVVEIAKDLGFEWGGDWQGFSDYPHLQMDFGLSLEELREAEEQSML
ncbi:M15 family metallopeptidase [Alteribacillus sp. HJP-4]|uniref:M15 family metallopeptidase n=1 Tax=Alteribacillus sp. HJP-4 TaxID=2775394 RepID=UPI0035CD18B3